MKNLMTFCCIMIHFAAYCQFDRFQYFDGNNPPSNPTSIIIDLDTNSSWKIGVPNKSIFNMASTLPNAILTDLDSNYSINDSSSFSFGIAKPQFAWGILALQWKQKIDFESDVDGGVLEYSVDSGNTWNNVINDPRVYSFYGFDPSNLDTLPNNTYAFSGTDTTWKDIWLCFDLSWVSFQDSIRIRYSIYSDSVDSQQEGWMIDNFIERFTIIHTLKDRENDEYLNISPNPSSNEFEINLEKKNELHYIKSMRLLNIKGEKVREWNMCPSRFRIQIGDLPIGIYFLEVNTNLKSETRQIYLTE